MQIRSIAHLFSLIFSTIGMSRSEMTQNRIVLSNRKVELNLSVGGVGISKLSLLTLWNCHWLFLRNGSFAKIQESPFLLFIPKASVNYSGVTATLATQVKKQVKSRWLSLFSVPSDWEFLQLFCNSDNVVVILVADVLRHVPVALEAAGSLQVRSQDRRTGKLSFYCFHD